MNETSKEKRIPKLVITLIILGVVILAVVFVVLATVGDDVPTVLAPATQTSPGNQRWKPPARSLPASTGSAMAPKS